MEPSTLIPSDYHAELRSAVARYITWIETPRTRTRPSGDFINHDKPSTKSIKNKILNGI